MRAGYFGALAAWTGFTLPSAAALRDQQPLQMVFSRWSSKRS
jgi:chromate transport protein ChrA